MNITEVLAKEFSIHPEQAQAAIDLIDEGNTIPFIARYRKEKTGNLDDAVLRELNTRLAYLRKLDKRREEVIAAITERGKMTPELAKAIGAAKTLTEVEDLYLPYKQKKRTRATIAREKGLEPLAELMFKKRAQDAVLEERAAQFVDPEKEVSSAKEALDGAMDIVAEDVSDDAAARKAVRNFLAERSLLQAHVTPDFADTETEFQNYYDYTEPIAKMADHRILAVNRGEKKKVLTVKLEGFPDAMTKGLVKHYAPKGCSHYLGDAIADSYKRLIFPSVERELRAGLKERAEASAIRNFGINLKKLLMTRPFKDKVTMGFDPAYRTGCKIAVLDGMGKVLETTTVYPTMPHHQVEKSERILLDMIERLNVELIAIGNGTASRESEQFVADMLKKTKHHVDYVIVNEAGASVYSASDLGTEEYPDLNVSLRGAISIGGRLQDPLAELVKIDPKHLGVGQYQHDVNQKALETVLDATVEDAVNNVGVNVNRASVSLLKHVSGVSQSIAKNIIAYREENGPFTERKQLLKVKGLGNKAYEQCAGFLRIPEGVSVLDNTGVHPESYDAAKALLQKLGLTEEDLVGERLKATADVLDKVNVKETAKELGIGEPTLRDIIAELKKPGRDPRDEAPAPVLKSDVMTIDDLEPGMSLRGTVRNVIDFGAFVDIGVHEDGLVHISEITTRYIKHPSEVLAVGDIVDVRVLSVDKKRERISLTMK
ncbi:MAG: RNA-binding transcriptional accessory protein [Eubacteriaceae bacterium]|nr:RNA-binding transcriptional accessory protein [Eubacteriaceae bacterium]